MKTSLSKVTKPQVSIVVPAYNSEYFITDFIKSLLKTRYPNYEVIIVFDPSPDNGVRIARKLLSRKKNWHIVENKKHLGLSNSLNVGIRKSKGDYISILAIDMKVDFKWLSELMKYLKSADSSVGAAIAKIYDYHHTGRTQVYRMYLMPQTGYVYIPEYGFKDSAKYKKEIAGFSGTEGIVFKKEVFEKAGLFDPDITILIYDLDMIWRTWLAGYKVVRIPTSKVYHWSIKEGRATTKWEFSYAKMISIFIQNYSFKYLIKYLPQLFFVYSIRAVITFIQGNPNPLQGWVLGVVWSIQNLSKTLEKRKRVQTEVRAVSDEYLHETIFSNQSLLSFYNYLRWVQKNISPKIISKESKEKGILTSST